MSALLSVDGPAYRVLNAWWLLVRNGLLWFLGCVPVVTAPVATLWLLDGAERQLSGRGQADRSEAADLAKRLIWPALRLFVLHVGALVVLVGAALGPSPGGMFDVLLPAVVLCAGATWLLLAPWSAVLLLRRRRGAWDAVRTAYLTAMRSPLLAAGCVAGLAGCVLVAAVVPRAVALLVLPALPGIAACLTVHTCDRAAPPGRNAAPDRNAPPGRNAPAPGRDERPAAAAAGRDERGNP